MYKRQFNKFNLNSYNLLINFLIKKPINIPQTLEGTGVLDNNFFLSKEKVYWHNNEVGLRHNKNFLVDEYIVEEFKDCLKNYKVKIECA